jgi:hypothetical protein
MRANSVIPLAVAAAKRSIVSFGPKLLPTVVRPFVIGGSS